MMDLVCVIPLLSSLFGFCSAPAPLAVGYVEGDYVWIAPIETAEVVDVLKRRGDRISAGEPLAALERSDAEISVAEATAALARAQSQLADLMEGKRPEEIAIVAASLNSARAQAREAERVLKRQDELLKRGITSQAAFDDAQTGLDIASAKVTELEANLAVAGLAARPAAIRAAEAEVDRTRAVLENAQWRLGKRTLSSPTPGIIYDIIRNPGDVAGPQSPVLSLLPDGAVKLRLYVGEPDLSSIAIGSQLTVRCDGCGTGMQAVVSYIASDPEFTPPVIYSLENRQKLVYLIEARPGVGATALNPGQIVDVILAGSDP